MINHLGRTIIALNKVKICHLVENCHLINIQCLTHTQMMKFSSTGGRKVKYQPKIQVQNINDVSRIKTKGKIDQDFPEMIDQELYSRACQNNPRIQKSFENLIKSLQQIKDPTQYQLYSDIIQRYINEQIYAYSLQSSSSNQIVDATVTSIFLMNPYLLTNYSLALNLKSSTEFRFRKYDQIITNIQNEMYLIIHLEMEHQMRQKIDHLCDMYLMMLVFNNHDLLRDVMYRDYLKVKEERNNKKALDGNQERKGRKVSKRKYHINQQQQSNLPPTQQIQKPTSLFLSLKSYFLASQLASTYYTKSIAYSVIGQAKLSLQNLCNLLNHERSNKQYLSLFLTVYLFFGNQNYYNSLRQGKSYDSAFIKEFAKNGLCRQNKERVAVEITMNDFPAKISLQDAEYLINSVLSFLLNEPVEWQDLTFQKLELFCFPIYLIAENYYMNGEIEKGSKIVEQLKRKILNRDTKVITNAQNRKGRRIMSKNIQYKQSQILQKAQQKQHLNQIQKNLLMLIKFFQLMSLYDKGQFEKIIALQQKFFYEQKQSFYQLPSVKNDILRSNIYQIFAQSYKKLNNKEKQQEYMALSVSNHAVNDTYEINQALEIEEGEMRETYQWLNPNKAKRINKKGILVHYLPFRASHAINGRGK